MNKRKAFIPITALMAALLLALVAAMTPFVVERDVAHAAATADNNRLHSLSINGVQLSPGFDEDEETYSARVPNNVPNGSVVVKAQTQNNAAMVNIGGQGEETWKSTRTVSLTAGSNNAITVVVDPVDTSASEKTYTVNVYRVADIPSTDKTLTTLALTGITLDPTFDSAVHEYDATVSHDTEKVTVSADATDNGAVVKLGGVNYNDTTGDQEIKLNSSKGSKTNIVVTVTPESGGSSQSYTITVYRQREVLSNNADLRSLSLGSGITLKPSFSSSETNYKARVKNSVDYATVKKSESDTAGGARAARTTPDPSTTGDSRQDISGDQVELAAGTETTITVTVTAENGSTKAYTVKVYRENHIKSKVKTLGTLTVTNSVGTGTAPTLSPAFDANADPQPEEYNSIVVNPVSQVTIAATPTHLGGMVSFAPKDDADDAKDDYQVDLVAGVQTTVTVTVTAEDGSTKDYAVKVYRNSSSLSTDNTVSSLTITGLGSQNGATTQVFTPEIPKLVGDAARINIRVSNATSHIKVKAVAHPAASVAISGAAGDGGQPITAGQADQNITVTVDPQDTNVDDGVYTINVYRENSPKSGVKTLSALTATTATATDILATASTSPASPAFVSGTTRYVRVVENTVEYVTVVATATHAGAMRKITPGDENSGTAGHQVNLTAGENTVITVKVTAEDGSTDDYTVTIYRKRALVSDVATLGSLSVTDVSGADQTLKPEFDSNEFEYNVRVKNGVGVVTIAATTTDPGASSNINDIILDDDPTIEGRQVSLSAGASRAFTITVTAENGDATKDYKLTLYRERATLSDNADLSDLTMSVGTMEPTPFSSSTTDYRLVVGNSVGSVTVSATMDDAAGASKDTLPKDGDKVTSGHQVNLVAGEETEITVTVTAEDGSTMKTYTVTAYRERAPKSDDANLSNLMLDGAALSPDFNSNTTTYTAQAAYSSNNITLSYDIDAGAQSVTVAVGRKDIADDDLIPSGNTSRSSSTVRLYLVGETKILVTVTAENGDTKKYEITVTRESTASSDAKLSALSLSGIDIEFDADTMAYTASVGSDVESTTIMATKPLGAKMAIMPADSDADMEGHQVALTPGNNTVTVTVTAEDGSATMTYTVTIGVGSDDTSLSSISLADSSGMNVPLTGSAPNYAASVAGSVESVTVMATATDANASVSGDGMQTLAVGENTITVTVTAENGTMMTYTIEVTRAPLDPKQVLRSRYDDPANGGNGNGRIDIDEVNNAIDDFFDGIITLDEVNDIIDLFFE